ncbi:hypothetical protein ppKF707_1520 [Metapseudomonas furukawaii]|nr:hypothetical protein ppKF707_1520 [Pseudomonas furukawaii]
MNGCALGSLADLPALGCCLVVGHPARVGVTLTHQLQDVDPVVPFPSDWVVRQLRSRRAGRPWPLPGCRPLGELFD